MKRDGRRNVENLDSAFERFSQQWPSWTWLRERLTASGLKPSHAEELTTGDSRSSWVIFAHPTDALGKQFELAPEVLVLVTPWDVAHANDIRALESILGQEIRVDPGFVLVIAHEKGAQDRLGTVIPASRLYLFVSGEVFENISDPQAFLRTTLREGLGSRRLFDVRLPAAGPQFFGREKELEALERDIRKGHCLGLFGLRKVGKTSLLGRVAEKFRVESGGSSRVVPIHVDLQTTHFNRRHFDGVVELLGRRLERALEDASLRFPMQSSDPLDRFLEAIEYAERTLHGRVLLIVDEYEVLLSNGFRQQDGLALLTWLRGTAQQFPKSFNFILAGRNEKLIAPARIGGNDNPMYRFLRTFRVSGLTPEDCRMMVRKLGNRMALRFNADALNRVVEETGGHPALVRTLGEMVDADTPTQIRNPAMIDGATIQRLHPKFALEVNEDMRELLNASNDIDERAGDYLAHLAHGVLWVGGDTQARIHNALVDYGILDEHSSQFRIQHFAEWLRKNFACPTKVAHG